MSDEGDPDGLVRRMDPDRWLASRYIGDEAARADVIALYAFNYELSRAAEVASQPLVGEMRLAWWREALEEMFEGRPVRRHPVALALAAAAARRGLERQDLEALVDARLRELDPWPLAEAEVEAFVDATAGGLMALAARVLSPEARAGQTCNAGRAWGLAGLARLGGRLPAAWGVEQVRESVGAALGRTRTELAGLPVAAFPAAAYATLAGSYATGSAPSDLSKRVKLTWAVIRGRV
jgi:15-cis-phytoene synthase